MASCAYLGKLPSLYRELKEGGLLNGQSEFQFLRETPAFYRQTLERMAGDLGSVSRYMRPHFLTRWHVDEDLYRLAIEGHMIRLEGILDDHPADYRNYLASVESPSGAA